MLNSLPTIIDSVGDYVTRNGRRVTIHAIASPSRPDVTAFAAKGALWRMFRGKMRPQGFAIWHVSGRYRPLKESPRDIVGKWSAE